MNTPPIFNQTTTIPLCRRVLWAVCGAVLILGAGCQALHTFSDNHVSKLDSARTWANGGLEALQSGHLQRAQGFFRRATEQRPNDFRARANLARAHFQSGDIKTAVFEMQQAVALSGNDPSMRIELGNMQLAVGNVTAARTQANQIINKNRSFVPAWVLQGRINRHEGAISSALINFHRAAGLAPNDLEIQMELANTYRANNEPLKALAAIDHLLNRHPVDAQPEQAILVKADILVQMDQQSIAIATLREALADHRIPCEALATKLIQTQINAGQLEPARKSLQALQANYPASEKLAAIAQQLNGQAIRQTIR